MGLKETVNHMTSLIQEMIHDLGKAMEGNKTAAQRVRTNSIKFAKLSKAYRKESVAQEKKDKGKPKAPKKTAPKKPVVKKAAPKKAAPKKVIKKKSR